METKSGKGSIEQDKRMMCEIFRFNSVNVEAVGNLLLPSKWQCNYGYFIYLPIYGSFNDTSSSLDYVTLNGRIIDEWKYIWKEGMIN
jgi:hypothetical protein